MEAAQAGDSGALDALLRRHIDRVHGVCRRITGNAADADDATQDALVAIAKGLARFDGQSRFTTWAYRVTVNTCLDELRRRKRRPVPSEAPLLEGASASFDNAVSERVDVDAALRGLPGEFRAAVVLRDLCGLDYAEIAEVLDVPPGTVRSRISRGRVALAGVLGNPTRPPTRQNERP